MVAMITARSIIKSRSLKLEPCKCTNTIVADVLIILNQKYPHILRKPDKVKIVEKIGDASCHHLA